MRETIRVVHVLGSLERGGVETWLMSLLPRLAGSGWQFDFCTLGLDPGRYADLARSFGSRVLSCPIRGRNWTFPWRFARLLRRRGYRIVHSHVHHFSSFVLAAAKSAGTPVRIAHSHNTHDGRGTTLARAFYRSAAVRLLRSVQTHALACSFPAAEALFGAGRRRDSRAEILHYGVDTSPVAAESNDRSRLRRDLGIEDGAPVIGHVGRLDRQKNHEFLLEVAAAMKTLRPEVRWLLVGEGDRRDQIEHRIRHLGLQSHVVLCGRRDDVPALMTAVMDALILPSLHEGLPMVLLEAQAAGLRSVASSRITPEAAAVDGAIEFLPLEAGAHRWALGLLSGLEAGRIPPARAGRQMETAGFTIDHSLRQLLDTYRLCLHRSRLS